MQHNVFTWNSNVAVHLADSVFSHVQGSKLFLVERALSGITIAMESPSERVPRVLFLSSA